MKDRMLSFLETNKLTSPSQHGFLRRHSTATNLLQSLNDWTICLNNSDSVTVAYVDFAKAFDSVSHPKLIAKLSNLGIAGPLLRWIVDFLAGRMQCTVVGHARSEMVHMISGVPQGSVLGPLLIFIFLMM